MHYLGSEGNQERAEAIQRVSVWSEWMEHVLGLECLICGEKYAPGEVDYVCPRHGDDGILDVVYDYGAIKREIDRLGMG